MATEEEVIDKLQEQFDRINADSNTMISICGADEDCRAKVQDILDAAMLNLSRARNDILGKSAAKIQDLFKAAEVGLKDINDALADIQNIKKAMETITAIVTRVGQAVTALGI